MTSWKLHLLYLGLGVALFIAGKYNATPKATPNRTVASTNMEKPILGAFEFVELGQDKGFGFIAKIDSGAETSSIHATDIQAQFKDGMQFVSFTTVDDLGKVQRLTRQVLKLDTVKSASGTGVRYFIQETIWIGDSSYDIEVNLADRKHLSRKFLIGKNLLKVGNYMIDTTTNFHMTRKPASLTFIKVSKPKE